MIFQHHSINTLCEITPGRCPLSIFCSRGTPTNPESTIAGIHGVLRLPRPCHLSPLFISHCRADWAHIRQSGPESGPGFQVKVIKACKLFPPHSAADSDDIRSPPLVHHIPREWPTVRARRGSEGSSPVVSLSPRSTLFVPPLYEPLCVMQRGHVSFFV